MDTRHAPPRIYILNKNLEQLLLLLFFALKCKIKHKNKNVHYKDGQLQLSLTPTAAAQFKQISVTAFLLFIRFSFVRLFVSCLSLNKHVVCNFCFYLHLSVMLTRCFFSLCVTISLYEPTSFFLKFIWIAYYKVSRLQIFFYCK